MGCAPSKANSPDFDPEDKPGSPKDKKKKAGKPSPKVKGKGQKDNEKVNNNTSPTSDVITPNGEKPVEDDVIAPVAVATTDAEVPVVSVTMSSAPPHVEASLPGGQDGSRSPRLEFFQPLKSATLGNYRADSDASPRKVEPPSTSHPDPFDTDPNGDDTDRPPKPRRTYKHVNWNDDDATLGANDVINEDEHQGRYSTFPRSARLKPRHSSFRERLEKREKGVTLDRKTSLRETTPGRRKDLDYRSSNVCLGRTLSPPGRGQLIEDLDFLFADDDDEELEPTFGSDKDQGVSRGSVRSMARAYQDLLRQREEAKKPKPPIRIRSGSAEPQGDEDADPESSANPDDNNRSSSVPEVESSTPGLDYPDKQKDSGADVSVTAEPGISVIEAINQQVIPDYALKEKKTIEELEVEWEAERQKEREAEEERERLAEIERQKEEEEKQRLAEIERQKEEEERERLAEIERQKEEELERQRQEELNAQQEVEKERLRQEAEEEGGVDPAKDGAQQEDRFYNNTAFEKPDIDPNDPQQQDAALRIQTKYRQHHARQTVEERRREQAAVKIQSSYRGFQDRKKVKDIRSDAGAASRAADEQAELEDAAGVSAAAEEGPPAGADGEEVVDIDLNDPEVAAAATKIQAGFKGYKARKEVNTLKQQNGGDEAAVTGEEEEVVDIDLSDPEVKAAAAKIQAGFKGYMVRKDMDAQKMGEETSVRLEDHVKTEEEVDAGEELFDESAPQKEEEIDIDLDDPEVGKAALKIQAGFKGMQARKEMKVKREGISLQEDVGEDMPEVGATDHHDGDRVEEPKIVLSQNETEYVDEIVTETQQETEPEAELVTENQGEGQTETVTETQADTEPVTELQKETETQDEDEVEVQAVLIPKTQAEDTVDAEVVLETQEEVVQDEVLLETQDEVVQDEVAMETPYAERLTETQEQTDVVTETAAPDLDPQTEGDAVTENGGAEPEAEVEAQEKQEDEASKDKEEIDIDLTDPEVEQAAAKIQAGFKGMQARKAARAQREGQQAEGHTEGGAPADDQPTQETDQNEAIDIDLNDPEVNQAATKIQASFKGMKARKEVQAMKEGKLDEGAAPENGTAESQPAAAVAEQDEVDIDLNDPEVQKAATKIQASFKGYKARKDISNTKQGEDGRENAEPHD